MATETRFSEQRLNVFRDEFFDAQFMRALTHQVYGGAELGECFWAAAQIKDGDFKSWVTVWRKLAESVEGKAEKSFANGHLVSAREAYLRASNYHRCAEFMISPGEPLHHEIWQKSRECFRMAGSLFDPPIQPVNIPFQDHRLPGYFIPAGAEGEKRPTVIVIGGGDSSGEELYFYLGEGARRRGYHALLVEGPGQRGALHTNPGLVFRHDYEIPMKSVIEYALERPEIDEDKLALYGLSLGGYLVLRTAAFENRIKACIANPPYIDFSMAQRKGLPAWIQNLSPAWLDRMLALVYKINPLIRFALDTYYWILGASTPSHIFTALKDFKIIGLEEQLTCPTLLIVGEGEGEEVLRQGHELYNRLQHHKTIRITRVEEGGDAHCVSNNLSLMNQIVFDWLDELFSMKTGKAHDKSRPVTKVIGEVR